MTAGSGSPWGGNKVVLMTANNVPIKRSVLADFTLATFGGYAPANFVLQTAYVGSDGLVHLEGAGVTFVATGAGLPVTVFGYGITNAAGTVWVGGQLFDAPVTLNFASDGVTFVPDIAYGF
jgi:hypothetical protein